VVAEVVGHANISITLDTYSHAIPAMQESAAATGARLCSAPYARREQTVSIWPAHAPHR
jgi:hypothetical protein